jgi:N-acetylglucosamine kinase-like BadF-type ATPase
MKPEHSYVVALEGGGSKTVTLAADLAGQVVAWGRGGSSLTLYVSDEDAIGAIEAALDAVTAPIDPERVGIVCLAMVGSGYSADPAGPLARRFPHARIVSIGEGQAAAVGAMLEYRGAVASAGTGSFGHAVGEGGKVGHAGGHGPLVGDEGSGYWVSVEAVRRAFWSLDARAEPTVLVERIRAHYGLRNLWEIIGRLYGPRRMSRHEVASLSPVVVAAAEDGDAGAQAVLEGTADQLARMAVAAIEQVRRAGDGWEGPIPLSCTGGLGLGAPSLRAAVGRRVSERVPEVEWVGPYLPAVGGCLVEALRQAGMVVEGEVVARLRRTLPAEVGAPRVAVTAGSTA